MNGQNGSTGDPASRVASSAPLASTEPSPRPSKAGSMTVCVNATADLVRWYSANPATSPSTSTSKRPASGLSTTLGSFSVTMTIFPHGASRPGGPRGLHHRPTRPVRRTDGCRAGSHRKGGAGARGRRPSVGLRRGVEGAVHHARVIRQPRPVAAGCGGGGSPARRADTEDVLIVSAQVPTALACVDHMKSVIPGLRWTTAHVLVSEGRLDTPHTALTGDTGRELRIATRPAPEGPADSCNTC